MTLLGRRRSRPLCYVYRGEDQDRAVVETCTRTIHGLPLLRPSPGANELIVGALGRAAEYYDVPLSPSPAWGTTIIASKVPKTRFRCPASSAT